MRHQIPAPKYFHQDANWRKLEEPEPVRFSGLGACVKGAGAEDAQRRGRPTGVEAGQGQLHPCALHFRITRNECKLTQCSVWAPLCADGPL